MYLYIIISDSLNYDSLRVQIENNKVIHASIHFAKKLSNLSRETRLWRIKKNFCIVIVVGLFYIAE